MIIRTFSLFPISLAFVVAALLGLPADQKVQTGRGVPLAQSGPCLPAQIRGSDAGAKINACDAKLGVNKGAILLNGGGTISTSVRPSSNHTLRVASGIYKATNDGATIRLKDNSSLVCNSWDAILEESTGRNGEGGVKPFTIVSAYAGFSRDSLNGSLARNLVIQGCHFRGARADFDSASQTVAIGNCTIAASRIIGWKQPARSAFRRVAAPAWVTTLTM